MSLAEKIMIAWDKIMENGDFTTIYEDEKVFFATHSVTQENTGPFKVMLFAKHENSNVTSWQINRAFE